MLAVLRISRDNVLWDFNPRQYSWLVDNDIPADPLQDLNTVSNSLSIWILDKEEANIDRFIAAYAANRQDLQKVDYIIFDLKILKELNIKYDNIPGKLKDTYVNDWHRDLIELSADKIIELAKAIIHSNYDGERKLPKEIAYLLDESIKKGWIDSNSLGEKLLDGMKKFL